MTRLGMTKEPKVCQTIAQKHSNTMSAYTGFLLLFSECMFNGKNNTTQNNSHNVILVTTQVIEMKILNKNWPFNLI